MTDDVAAPANGRLPFTIKTLLIPLLARPRVAQFIKYAVYLSLVVNFGVYVHDDWLAYKAALADDAPWSDIFTQFSTTIDMAAWLGLVFVFELETYVLPDHAFDARMTRVLRLGRLFCYASILYAAYGYTSEAIENYDARVLAGVSNLCEIANQETFIQVDTATYIEITQQNCATLSDQSIIYQIADETSVIDGPTLEHVRWQGWIDIDNAFVWLIVVMLIEIELWLQSNDRFSSRTLSRVRKAKTFFYAVLTVNLVVWGVSGYPLYAWDAFLWIFGFWAIELNLAEWERDRKQELSGKQTPMPGGTSSS